MLFGGISRYLEGLKLISAIVTKLFNNLYLNCLIFLIFNKISTKLCKKTCPGIKDSHLSLPNLNRYLFETSHR